MSTGACLIKGCTLARLGIEMPLPERTLHPIHQNEGSVRLSDSFPDSNDDSSSALESAD